MKNDQVLACIDGSTYAASVCDHSAWAARRLGAPVTALHAMEHRHGVAPADLSGSIGFGSQEALLEALAAHDHETGKLALARGRLLLDSARARLVAAGVTDPQVRQVHGLLVDQLAELEPTIRLAVIGRRGEGADAGHEHLGANLERVVRALHRPILVVPDDYREPAAVMLAFDGGANTRKAVEILMRGPLFKGLPCHIVTAGEPGGEMERAHDWARQELQSAGFDVHGGVMPGDPESVIPDYQRTHGIDLVVMGAYGHSRIRELLVGSTTTAMLRAIPSALLLLR